MIYFTGDICLTDNDFDAGYGIGTDLKNGINPFINICKEDSDVWIGNFEGVTSWESNRKGWNRRCFNVCPDFLKICDSYIDYWSIANNHVMEHGPDAYYEMESVLNSISKGVFGSIHKKSIIIESFGSKVGVVSFSLRNDHTNIEPLYWNFPEYNDIKVEIDNLINATYKVAYIHWGIEYINYPSWQQQKLGHFLIDSGFDLVIGMHPHVLQGFEVYKGKHIFYSLGNFVFNMPYLPACYGAVVGLDELTGKIIVEYVYINNHKPVLIPESEVPCEFHFQTINKKIPYYGNSETYMAEAQKMLHAFQKANRLCFLRNIYRFDRDVLSGMITDFVKRKL